MATTEIITIIESNKLEPATAAYIQQRFAPFFDQAKEWKEKADALVVTDVSQKKEMKMAREARLALRQIRIEAEKVRKSLKEDSLRYGRAVDGVYNVIEAAISPIEKHLEIQEKFEEVEKARIKAEIRSARQEVLQPFLEYVPYGIDIAELPEEEFVKILNGARLQKEYAEQQRKREAEERAAAEERQRVERERLEKERREAQAKLEIERKERAEIEAKLEKERKEAEAKLEKERKEKEAKLEKERKERAEVEAKLAEELKLKKLAEEKAAADLKAKKAAERKLAAAPDKEKILHFIRQVASLSPIGSLKTTEAIHIIGDFTNALSELQMKAENL